MGESVTNVNMGDPTLRELGERVQVGLTRPGLTVEMVRSPAALSILSQDSRGTSTSTSRQVAISQRKCQ